VVCAAMPTVQGARDQTARTPSWVTAPSCRLTVEATRRAPEPIDPYSATFACAVEPSVLSCDAENAVSFDVDRSVACRQPSLPWRRARLVSLTVRDAELQGVQVQTVEVDHQGQPLVVASRPVGTGARVNVPVGVTALLRIVRAGAAPITLEVPGDQTAPVLVPPPVAGGEVFVGLAEQPFPPVDLVLTGQGHRFVGQVRERRWTAISHVPPGTYQLSPRYLGGVVGPIQEVIVQPQRTASVLFGPKDVGALQVDGEGALCHEVDDVRVVRHTSRNGARVEAEVARTVKTADCRYRFEGLPAATYTVLFTNRVTGPLAESTADVVRDRVAVVTAAAPGVRLLGSVLRDGRPLEGAVELLLSSSLPGAGGNGARTRVMAAGAFELTAPEPGAYIASIVIDGLLIVGTQKSVVLNEGVNRLDWEIPAGSLTVDIDGWDRQSNVVLEIRRVGEDLQGVVGTGRGVAPDENLPLVIRGLRSGTFDLVARQVLNNGEQRISARHTVTVDEKRSTAPVTLTLRSYSAEIEVMGRDGWRIAAARVAPGEGASLRESEPGLFPLEASLVEPGAPMMISASGYAPTCIAAPSGGRHTVVMADGVSSRVTYTTPPAALPRPVGRLHWPGLACHLPSGLFSSELLNVDPETRAVTFMIGGLPPGLVVTLVVGGSGFPTESVSFRSGQDATLSLRKFR